MADSGRGDQSRARYAAFRRRKRWGPGRSWVVTALPPAPSWCWSRYSRQDDRLLPAFHQPLRPRIPTHQYWDPVFEEFGALPFIFGTIVSSLLALLIGGPISLGAAIYLSELAPDWLRSPVSFLVELLAAIPSVVYGLWGIFVLAPWLRTFVRALSGQNPRLPAALPGPAVRRRDAGGRPDPGHHDHPHHHRRLAGRDAGGARHPARGACSPWGRPGGRR